MLEFLICDTDEEKGWAITERELELRRTAAVERDGLEIRALTLINPGNPTGQVLSREELEIICKFCAKYDIVLLADEVYQVSRAERFCDAFTLSISAHRFFYRFILHQKNIYDDGKEFFSARKGAKNTPSYRDMFSRGTWFLHRIISHYLPRQLPSKRPAVKISN